MFTLYSIKLYSKKKEQDHLQNFLYKQTRTKVVHKNVTQDQTSFHEKFVSLVCKLSYQILIRSDFKKKYI